MRTVFSSSDANSQHKRPAVSSVDDKLRTIMTPLTAFAISPQGIKFETQEDEENVVLFLRQHLIVLFWPLITVLVLAFSPFVLLPFFAKFLTLPISIPSGYVVVGTAFWYVVTFGVALLSFLRWYFNIYIVTDKRIVDIDFIHLLYKEFSEARIERIQDISFTSGGIFATIFHYGDVTVTTAGEFPNLEFAKVPYPEKVVQTISELIGKQ